jgi:hypothetical protein
MSGGNLRRLTAAALLAFCLTLVLPGSAKALMLERGAVDRPAIQVEQEVGFWQNLWDLIQSFWLNSSVLITPEGFGDGDGGGTPP